MASSSNTCPSLHELHKLHVINTWVVLCYSAPLNTRPQHHNPQQLPLTVKPPPRTGKLAAPAQHNQTTWQVLLNTVCMLPLTHAHAPSHTHPLTLTLTPTPGPPDPYPAPSTSSFSPWPYPALPTLQSQMLYR